MAVHVCRFDCPDCVGSLNAELARLQEELRQSRTMLAEVERKLSSTYRAYKSLEAWNREVIAALDAVKKGET